MLLGLILDFPWCTRRGQLARQFNIEPSYMRNSCEVLGITDGSKLEETVLIPMENMGNPALLVKVFGESSNY